MLTLVPCLRVVKRIARFLKGLPRRTRKRRKDCERPRSSRRRKRRRFVKHRHCLRNFYIDASIETASDSFFSLVYSSAAARILH
ncbi:hypothetical protein MTP99_015067 [Tenebrio molitor]|nr:hypothetical protein MTP99_015067 [Tenebrio molitor]